MGLNLASLVISGNPCFKILKRLTFNDSQRRQRQQAPVVSWYPLPPGLPAVHPFAVLSVLIGQEHWLTIREHSLAGREEIVGCEEDLTSGL